MKTLAELIDDLFRTHRKPNGKEYRHLEVCVMLEGAIEPSHLGKLRNGTITNPRRDTLLALCQFFQVDPCYFFPELMAEVPQHGRCADPINALMDELELSPTAKQALDALLRSLCDRTP